MFNQSVPRSVISDAEYDADRSVLRVRNIRESAVYHLTFDGDIGRLTGYQLRAHIKSICGASIEQQILTFNGQPISNDCTGYEVGLRPGAMLILDFVNRASVSAANASTSRPRADQLVRGSSEVAPSYQPNRFAGEVNTTRHTALESVPRGAGDGSSRHGHTVTPYAAPVSAYTHSAADEIDIDVEIEEEPAVEPWAPTSSVETEESRLLQQDYAWKMEQVRFETERMHREREMMRQRQELEYQSELLERERLEFERKTRAEKLKLSMMHNAMQEEMSIQAQISSYHEVCQPYASYRYQ